MRYILLVFVLFCPSLASAQSFTFPKLPLQGSSIATVIPANWKVIDTAYGDLNHDKLDDLVLVLEYKDEINETRAYGDADTEIIKEFQKPRILVVYFKSKNQYIFKLQNNNFILRSDEGGAFGDPYQQVSINNNRLVIAFTGGSAWRWILNYQFKYENDEWLLVNATNTSFNVSFGEMNSKEYNFTSKKLKETKGNMFDHKVKEIIAEKNLIITKLRTFKTFKKPWTWEITKDEFL